jgi:hypothetical protein
MFFGLVVKNLVFNFCENVFCELDFFAIKFVVYCVLIFGFNNEKFFIAINFTKIYLTFNWKGVE